MLKIALPYRNLGHLGVATRSSYSDFIVERHLSTNKLRLKMFVHAHNIRSWYMLSWRGMWPYWKLTSRIWRWGQYRNGAYYPCLADRPGSILYRCNELRELGWWRGRVMDINGEQVELVTYPFPIYKEVRAQEGKELIAMGVMLRKSGTTDAAYEFVIEEYMRKHY